VCDIIQLFSAEFYVVRALQTFAYNFVMEGKNKEMATSGEKVM
jgi:hypothetical protein